jgi:hypothetical protein
MSPPPPPPIDCAVVLFGVFAYNSYRRAPGGPAGKRQACELDFKIKKLKEFASGQTPTSLLREFDLPTSAVKTMLENREHINVRGSAEVLRLTLQTY